MPDNQKPLNAIISVSDPANLEALGKALSEMGASIYATGGTKVRLQGAGIEAHSVSDLTGFPEILGGRIKTLHPGVHSGILAKRDDPDQMAQLREHGLQTIDLVAVNLYPFAQTISKEDVTLEEAVEQIDIGGPTMIRAAAKNFASVIVLSDPADYAPVLAEWRKEGEVSQATRRRLAAKAFRHVSEYDTLIANYLVDDGQWTTDDSEEGRRQKAEGSGSGSGETSIQNSKFKIQNFAERLVINLTQEQSLRYGENPHQVAALYRDDLPASGATLVGSLKQLHGPELSYNNLLDADAALALVRDYRMPAVAIIKHATPCGIACGGDEADMAEIFGRALAADAQSAFGGIIGINRYVDGALAQHIAKTRFDVLVAPGFSEEAIETLARKKNLRLLSVPDPHTESRRQKAEGSIEERQSRTKDVIIQDEGRDTQQSRTKDVILSTQHSALMFRQISGGFLVQTRDAVDEDVTMEPVTLRHPTLEEIADLTFAWRAVKHVRSNAIVLARKLTTVGIGGGQTSRIDAVRIAAEKAGAHATGAVMASDAFFPFPDGIEAAAQAGVTAIIQPGGSVNDDAVIEAADVAGLAMVFTRKRHFKH